MKKIEAERRRSSRFAVRERSALQLALGEATYECLVVNLSDGGAGIVAENVAVPRNFLLSAHASPAHKHRCTIIWGDGFRIGVKFTPVLRVVPN
jgi:hypothetical protein